MAIVVTRKDDKEPLENMIRRFNRKVQQSGVLGVARRKRYFEKAPSKKVMRTAAIKKRERREIKMQKIVLGR